MIVWLLVRFLRAHGKRAPMPPIGERVQRQLDEIHEPERAASEALRRLHAEAQAMGFDRGKRSVP